MKLFGGVLYIYPLGPGPGLAFGSVDFSGTGVWRFKSNKCLYGFTVHR